MADYFREVLSAFQAIDDASGTDTLLRKVWYVRTEDCLGRVVLGLGKVFLSVVADQDHDTVKVWKLEGANFDAVKATDLTQCEPWGSYVGKSFGWGWATVNQQGYCDGLMLSFAGLKPQMCLNVVASSIKVYKSVRFQDKSPDC